MDIVAESLSAKILKSREVLVNGKDIMDYIRSKLSTAVEFNGVYESLEEATEAGANYNGSIIIVQSKEYIWSDKKGDWVEIGDETAAGQLIKYIETLSGNVKILSNDISYIGSISADLSCKYKLSAEAGSMAYKNANDYSLLSDIPTYSDISTNIHLSDYALINQLSSASDISIAVHLSDYALLNDVSSKSDLNAKFNTLSTYNQTKTQLSSDGYALTSDIPTYSDISTNIHLSDYALINQLSSASDISIAVHLSDYALLNDVSSKSDLNAKFNTLSTYNQTKTQLSSDGYALTSDIPTDLSAFTNSPGYLSAIPSTYKTYTDTVTALSGTSGFKTYEQTKNDLSNNNYVVIGKDNDVSSANTLYGAKAYAKDYVAEYVDKHSSKNQIHSVSAWEKTELSNYVLGNGEIAIATTDDNFKMKVGDGSSTFHQLPYFSNMINISYAAYSQLIIDENVDPNILYVVSSDYINAYGQQMKNLSTGNEENDAVTFGQLSALSIQLGSMAYKLSSDYVLTSTTIVGKELSNNITVADISTAVHLSEYALSNDVSSKTELETAFNEKLDATAGAKAFSNLSTYSLHEHVSYNGLIWECISAITTAGPWNENNWRITDMTSPDATLDVTNDNRLRVISADGSIIWQQGYNITQDQYSTITANIDVLSSLVTAANNSLETILNESL